MKFVVDAMLGNVARWLRILGYDTFYSPHNSAKQNITLSINENRTLITCNNRIKEWHSGSHYLLLKNVPLHEQVIDIDRIFSPFKISYINYLVTWLIITACGTILFTFANGSWGKGRQVCSKINADYL